MKRVRTATEVRQESIEWIKKNSPKYARMMGYLPPEVKEETKLELELY